MGKQNTLSDKIIIRDSSLVIYKVEDKSKATEEVVEPQKEPIKPKIKWDLT